ncbi:Clp protease N-terminal domain-containing protein [Nonomuraea zeae]|uniref:Clp protease n=1 Tax=Nonomuraea zeae TaxID=1642303 RepID=A0A5S4GN64_9ACTN|nr:Clp protease N-terminal domain-containing protein [Nonomuraea zeae]TMR34385.1 Clp protease [Nonomuraea zeae]
MSAIDHYINALVLQGEREARQDGSAAVEAHHVLLAIAGHEDTAARRVLLAAGLDRQAIRDALDREFEHSLNAAGVSLAAFSGPPATPDHKRRVGMGASLKLALERGFGAATGKKDLRPAHVLLGILEAEVGTVPRALAQAGADRAELIARVRATTANESW